MHVTQSSYESLIIYGSAFILEFSRFRYVTLQQQLIGFLYKIFRFIRFLL